jgi:hypothetical protein
MTIQGCDTDCAGKKRTIQERETMKRKVQNLHSKFASIWWGDRGLSALLVLLSLLLLTSLVGPIFDSATAQRVRSIFFSLLLLSGFTTMADKRIARTGISLVVVTGILFIWMREFQPDSLMLQKSAGLVVLVYLCLLTLVVIGHVFRAGPVTGGRIQDAVAAYLLIGLTWTQIYLILQLYLPGSIGLPLPASALTEQAVESKFTYFSFVTLTTLGYGDIVPIHPVARMFVVLEALIGQLFPATLLARLVALETMNRSRDGHR